MLNGKVIALLVLAALVILVGRAERPAPPPLPASSGDWTAATSNGAYVETGTYQGQTLAMTVTPGAAGAALDISGDPDKLPAGGDIGLHGTFDDNTSFAFSGEGDGGVIHADISAAQMPGWTRHLAGGGSLVLSFDDQSAPPLVFPLAGAAPTLQAWGAALRQGGGTYTYTAGPGGAAAVAGVLGLSITSFLVLIAVLYLLPAVVAYARRSTQSGIILVLNLLLGWTVIGWWLLLLVALLSPARGIAPRGAL